MRLPSVFRRKAAARIGEDPSERGMEILQAKLSESGNRPAGHEALEAVLAEIPAIDSGGIDWGHEEASGIWWCRFTIDPQHRGAMRTIQHLAYELNDQNANDFSGAFYPTSPPAGINGLRALGWMIDSWDGETSAAEVARMLELAADALAEEERQP